ncbi:MAG: endonuclease/exonuclease/phosphatase family protein, partial [Clostridia bacterium]|nr:endonuclease/exonuclease/phosphatase family protein [Clostridia bacterium]
AAGAAETAYTSQLDTSVSLFKISSPNKAGQEFVPDSTTLQGVRVYLQNDVANNQATVDVYKGTVTATSGEKIHTETITLTGTGAKWYDLMFQTPLTVTVGEKYTFSVNTTGHAVWCGVQTSQAPTYSALNYDPENNHFWVRNNSCAFRLISVQPFDAVIELINKLPKTITLEHETQIMEARAAYDALFSDQQEKVTNYAVLTAAEETLAKLKTADRDNALLAIEKAVNDLGDITGDSKEALEQINQMVLDFSGEFGYYQLIKNDGYKQFKAAIETYNEVIKVDSPAEKIGDVNTDTQVDAKDALEVLKSSVGKITFTQQQEFVADVDNDGQCNAKDALMILQFAVGKRTEFPKKQVEYTPYEEKFSGYSAKGEALYAATYQSMIDRIREDGYAQTSLTGAYEGMFPRDSSIQIMAHVAQGDFDQARMILNYLTEYHRAKNLSYVMHIIRTHDSYIKQTDTTFFFLHSWYLFATQAPKTAQNKAYIEGSYDMVKKFANYYLDNGYLHDKYDLLFNESLEHSRDGDYWQAYDLLTNVYASQALHEMADYFKTSDPANAKKWEDAASKIVAGVHKNLVTEIDGKIMYAELIGKTATTAANDPNAEDKFVQGFSWVNLAPMGCDWYAADPEILENTYQLYMQYGSCRYYRKYQMLDVFTKFNGRPIVRGNHVIGKGLAWEMMYCKKMGYDERLAVLTAFVEEYSEDMYRETWVYSGGGSDTANQEHASWMLVANKLVYPQLGASSQTPDVPEPEEPVTGVRVGTYNIHILQDVNRDASVIAQDIIDSGLDIVGVQEVDKNTLRTGKKDQAKELAEALGWYYGYSKAIDLEGGEYGTAILSKYPIESYTIIQLESGSEEQRAMGHAVINAGDTKINFLNTHLSFGGMQSNQITQIAEYVKNLDNFILTGDFNTQDFTALGTIGGTLVNNATDTFVTCGGDGAIDNIIVKKFTSGKGTMVDNNHSDHNMLFADITF